MNVLGMKVGWGIGWANLPDLHMLLDEEPQRPEVWRKIPVNGGTYFIARQEPVVRFLFESERGGGALGRGLLLEDGSGYKTNGGWSSSEGQVNRLRALDERFADYLPYDVVGITYYAPPYARTGTYNEGWGLGMAGVCFDLPWAQEMITKHLPGVELVDTTNRDADGREENEASGEQSMVIGDSVGYGYVPAPIEREGTTRESIKPDVDSELFLRTAMEWDRKRAEQEKQKQQA